MPCVPIKMPDGSVLLANMKPGVTLTDEDKAALVEYQTFVRRRSKREKPERYCPAEECFWAKSNGVCPKHGKAETVPTA